MAECQSDGTLTVLNYEYLLSTYPMLGLESTLMDKAFLVLKKLTVSRTLVAHTCNPRYSGGRNQENHGLKPAWANSS
jgi:hypothetical protein